MPWEYQFNHDLGIVEAEFSGAFSAADLSEATTEFIAVEKSRGINRFLIDATSIRIDSTLADLYENPTRQFVEEGADRLGMLAILRPQDGKSRSALEFYANVCKNRGWMVSVFESREEALDWLLINRDDE